MKTYKTRIVGTGLIAGVVACALPQEPIQKWDVGVGRNVSDSASASASTDAEFADAGDLLSDRTGTPRKGRIRLSDGAMLADVRGTRPNTSDAGDTAESGAQAQDGGDMPPGADSSDAGPVQPPTDAELADTALPPQCESLTGTYTITSQQDLLEWDELLSESCGVLDGTLIIESTSSTDLSELSGLKIVTEDLRIWQADYLISLSGLENLETVGGDFIIQGYSLGAIQSIGGVNVLETIGGNLMILGSETMTSIDGFRSLVEIGGDLELFENHALLDIDGFDILTFVGGAFDISTNDSLVTLGNASVGGTYVVSPGFQKLSDIGGAFQIRHNPLVSTCEIRRLRDRVSIDGGIMIESNLDDAANCPSSP